MTENDLLVQLLSVISRIGYSFEKEPSIGGLRPDFIVHGPEGRTIVIEAKNWGAGPVSISRAISQASKYKDAIGADAAFVVLPNIEGDRVQDGVVSIDGLRTAILNSFAEPRSGTTPKAEPRYGNQVFAAMPFSANYDDVYFLAMAPAAKKIGGYCYRVDQEGFTGDITVEVLDHIRESVAVFADLSESRPNVLYELGYAHALKIPTINICSTPLENLPFDVRNLNTSKYSQGQIHLLRDVLADRLMEVV